MYLAGTQRLIDYWQGARGAGFLPPRQAMNPADFPTLLPQMFVWGHERAGCYPLRLAGEGLVSLHGAGLRGMNGPSLFAAADRPALQTAIEGAGRIGRPLVISAVLEAADIDSAPVEILLAPLAGIDGQVSRYLGLYQTAAPLRRRNDQPVAAMRITSIRFATCDQRRGAPLRLVADNGRRVA